VQHRPPCGDECVEPAPVPCELARLTVPSAVVLARHASVGEGQVDARHEPTVRIADGALGDGDGTGEGEHHPQPRLLRRLRPGVGEVDGALGPSSARGVGCARTAERNAGWSTTPRASRTSRATTPSSSGSVRAMSSAVRSGVVHGRPRTWVTSEVGRRTRRTRRPATGPNRTPVGTETSTGVRASTRSAAPWRWAAVRPLDTAPGGTSRRAPLMRTANESGRSASAQTPRYSRRQVRLRSASGVRRPAATTSRPRHTRPWGAARRWARGTAAGCRATSRVRCRRPQAGRLRGTRASWPR
jgi:hypothetical protein